jgi:Fe-S-cluster containining protein
VTTAVLDFPNLREGVLAVRAERGVVFHDALRWRLYFVEEDKDPGKVYRWLVEQGLVAGAEVPMLRPRETQVFLLSREQAPDVDYTLLGEARFACSNCGDSCRSMNLGPIFLADAQRLLDLDWTGTGYESKAFFADRAGTPLTLDRLEPGRDLFLRRKGDRCQFLRDDNLCEVHARFGADAKPHMCRLFPVQLRAAPSGVVVGLRLGECARAPEANAGPPLGEDVEPIRQLYREMPKVPTLPPLVWLTGSALVPCHEYEALERKLLLEPAAAAWPGAAHGGGVAFLLRAMAALAERAPPPVPPCSPEDLAGVRAWTFEDDPPPAPSALPLARGTAAGLDADALALEERVARLMLFNKDAFHAPDVLSGVARLAVSLWLSRQKALSFAGREGKPQAAPRHLNAGVKQVSSAPLRELLEERQLDPIAVAASIALLAF